MCVCVCVCVCACVWCAVVCGCVGGGGTLPRGGVPFLSSLPHPSPLGMIPSSLSISRLFAGAMCTTWNSFLCCSSLLRFGALRAVSEYPPSFSLPTLSCSRSLTRSPPCCAAPLTSIVICKIILHFLISVLYALLRLLRLRRLRRLHRLLRRLSPGGVRRRRGLRVLTLMRALVRVPMVLVLVRVLVLVLALVCHLAVPPPRPPRYSRRLLRPPPALPAAPLRPLPSRCRVPS